VIFIHVFAALVIVWYWYP